MIVNKLSINEEPDKTPISRLPPPKRNGSHVKPQAVKHQPLLPHTWARRRLHAQTADLSPRDPERQAAKKMGQPITDPNDPRWILATRTASMLEGCLLSLERRNRLMKLGRLLGLTAFDTNLVIAIVQDQARRGFSPDYCPTAGEPQLRMIPVPNLKEKQTRQNLLTACAIAVLVLLELVAINWVLSF